MAQAKPKPGGATGYLRELVFNATIAKANGAPTNRLASVQRGGTIGGIPTGISQTNTTVSYDANGNMTNDGQHVYKYDALNRQVAVLLVDNTTKLEESVYNTSGERVGMVSYQGGAVTGFTKFLRDGAAVVYEKSFTISGSTHANKSEKTYLYGAGRMAVTKDTTLTGTAVSTYTYYGVDHLGTVRYSKTINSSGATVPNGVVSYALEPFGVMIPGQSASISPNGNTHLYTGQERDTLPDGSNMDYMHFRFFSSNMGRFQKPDSVFGSPLNPQGWNLYSYVHGNPVNFNDPTGHAPKGGDPDPTTPEEIRKQELTDLLGGPLGEHSFVEMSGRPDPGSDYFVYKYTSISTGMSFTSFAKLTSDLVISIFKVAREVYLLTTGTDRVNGGIEAAGMVIWNPRTGEIRGMAMRSPMAKMPTDERLRLYGERWRNKFDFNSSEWWAAVHALFGGGNPVEWISLAIFHGHRDSESATASFDDTHGSREFLNKRLGISAPLLYGAVSRDGISWYHEGIEGFSEWPNWLQGW